MQPAYLYLLIGQGIIIFAIAFIRQWISSRHDNEARQYMVENTLPMLVQESMKEHTFWQIINRSKSPNNDIRDQAERLKALLNNLSKLEIVAFDRRFQQYLDRLYHWHIWGAIYLFNGGCPESTFTDFRSWLLGQGKERFEAVLQNPEIIIDFVKPGDNWAGLQYCASTVYHKKTGDVLLPYHWVDRSDENDPEASEDIFFRKEKPSGEKWNEHELPILFPNIAKAISSTRTHRT